VDVFLLAAGLVAYNNLLNRSAWFNGAPFVPLNLAAAAVLVAIALGPLELTARAIGLDLSVGGLALGAAIGGGIAAPLLVLASNPKTARLIADKRSAGLAGRRLAYQAMVRVPLGTALLEEIAFRGVLFAAASSAGTLAAAVISSVAFGLWHVMPSLNMLAANRPGAPNHTRLIFAAGTVALTTAAGVGLIFLREVSGDIAAPLAAHATLNSFATLAAARAGRRRALQLGVDLDDPRERLQSGDEVLRPNSGGKLDESVEQPSLGLVFRDLQRLKPSAEVLDNASDVAHPEVAVNEDLVSRRSSTHLHQSDSLEELQPGEDHDRGHGRGHGSD